MPGKEELQKGFVIGDWTVLPARGELRSGDQVEHPERMVMLVLLALAARDGDVVTKDELVDEVWGGRATSDDTIVQKISQLRGHLGDKQRPNQYIETLTRVGYRLLLEVQLPVSESAPRESVDRKGAQSSIRAAVYGVLALLVVFFVWWMVNPPMRASVASIAVLPCENLSGNSSDQYLVDGFKEQLVETLGGIPDFAVMPIRVSYPDLEAPEIAEMFGVDSVLFCAVQREGETLKVNYHVARGGDGINISSGSITGAKNGLFRLQVELAVTVRDDVLGKSNQHLGTPGREPDAEALDRYLRGRHVFNQRAQLGYLEEAIDLFEEAIEHDPLFGQAYLKLAEAYALLPDARNKPLHETHELALATVRQGIEADPGISEAANAVFGFVYHKQKNWVQAEQAFVRAINAADADSNAFNWYAIMLSGVGRLDDALQQALAGLPLDPSSAVINSRIAVAYTWIGDNENAAEFFERSAQLGGAGTTQLPINALVLARQGDFDGAEQLLTEAVLMAGGPTNWIPQALDGLRDPEQRATGLATLDRAAEDRAIDQQIELTLRSMLGDTEGALRVATLLVRPDITLEMDLLFLPELEQLQRRPEFLGLLGNLGITDYWEEVGCVWQDFAVRCPEPL